ncbi:MAG: hypothetical protein ABI855_07355 [Bacteroidota bacterium]
MNEEEQLKTLSDIRNLMERSSRFLSLSGLSGVFIGLFAFMGFFASWKFTTDNGYSLNNYFRLAFTSGGETNKTFYVFYFAVAFIVLVISLTTAAVLTHYKSKRKQLELWDATAKRLVINLLIPLICGGLFLLVLVKNHYPQLIAPCMLIFYGLTLLNVSKYTFDEIRNLGIIEIVLGLAASYYPGFGLILWVTGFGAVHIIYGILMYNKYER